MGTYPKAGVFLAIVNIPHAMSKEAGPSLGIRELLQAYMDVSESTDPFILPRIHHSLMWQGFLLVPPLFLLSLYLNPYLMAQP